MSEANPTIASNNSIDVPVEWFNHLQVNAIAEGEVEGNSNTITFAGKSLPNENGPVKTIDVVLDSV